MSTTQTQTALPTGTWTVDPVHSAVGFAVDYIAGTFKGAFSKFDASASALAARAGRALAGIGAGVVHSIVGSGGIFRVSDS